MSKGPYMTMEELVTVYPRLEAGEAVIEPEDWAFCYHEDVTQLLAIQSELLRSAQAAWHLCESLLACPGATPELISEVRDALKAAIAKAEGRS